MGNARAMLHDNPQMCYALLHAQLLLGLTRESKQMPDSAEIAQLRAEHAAYRPMMPMSVPPGSGVVVPPTARPAFVPARPAFAGARAAPYSAPPGQPVTGGPVMQSWMAAAQPLLRGLAPKAAPS